MKSRMSTVLEARGGVRRAAVERKEGSRGSWAAATRAAVAAGVTAVREATTLEALQATTQ